jgi:hypothetical protein
VLESAVVGGSQSEDHGNQHIAYSSRRPRVNVNPTKRFSDAQCVIISSTLTVRAIMHISLRLAGRYEKTKPWFCPVKTGDPASRGENRGVYARAYTST